MEEEFNTNTYKDKKQVNDSTLIQGERTSINNEQPIRRNQQNNQQNDQQRNNQIYIVLFIVLGLAGIFLKEKKSSSDFTNLVYENQIQTLKNHLNELEKEIKRITFNIDRLEKAFKSIKSEKDLLTKEMDGLHEWKKGIERRLENIKKDTMKELIKSFSLSQSDIDSFLKENPELFKQMKSGQLDQETLGKIMRTYLQKFGKNPMIEDVVKEMMSETPNTGTQQRRKQENKKQDLKTYRVDHETLKERTDSPQTKRQAKNHLSKFTKVLIDNVDYYFANVKDQNEKDNFSFVDKTGNSQFNLKGLNVNSITDYTTVNLDGNRYIASVGKNPYIYFWDISKKIVVFSIKKELDGEALETFQFTSITTVIIEDKQYIACGANDKLIHIYDHQEKKFTITLRGQMTPVSTLTTVKIKGKQMLLSNSGNEIKIWDVDQTIIIGTLRGHTKNVKAMKAITIKSKKYLASSSVEGEIILWDIQSQKKVRTWKSHSGSVDSINFFQTKDKDENYYLSTSGDDNVIRVWNIQTKKLAKAFPFSMDIFGHSITEDDGKLYLLISENYRNIHKLEIVLENLDLP